MKVFSAAQIKQWDAYTIAHEPVSSIDLMERAAGACFKWLQQQFPSKQSYSIFCGRGNNGGDGLAIARMLIQEKHNVSVFILHNTAEGSPDFKINLKKLETATFNIRTMAAAEDFPLIQKDSIVIDAIFGTGLNKPPGGLEAALVSHINQSAATVIAVDIPSGLFAGISSKNNTVIKAAHTLSFQQPKLAFFMGENEAYYGNVHVLDIGLSKQFAEEEPSAFHVVDKAAARSVYKPRKRFSHKGSYGHAALLTGSYGMMGAAVLSAGACMKSGAGKLTCIIPGCGYNIMQTAVPEAMCKVQGEEFIDAAPSMDGFNAIGIGPGMGVHAHSSSLLRSVFQTVQKPLVLDADALNIMAADKELLSFIPPGSVLTPHPKEFERLFGTTGGDFERMELALQKSKEHNCYIVLKGHYTFTSCPDGKGYFNAAGNAGMATAGSGDVLTGIITGLLAQAYSPLQAALLGVYLHGAAGDFAAEKLSEEAMTASDISRYAGEVFKSLANKNPG